MNILNINGSDSFELITFKTHWIGAAIVILALLPVGVGAQSTPTDDQVSSQQEAEINVPQETEVDVPQGIEINVHQNSYQEQNIEAAEQDFSNPYQQPVITESELDQLEQAQKSLGVPETRRPQFNNFFGAEERAINSREESENFR
jgi:hypothetical protein